MESPSFHTPHLTAEKLAIIKLATGIDPDIFAEPASPLGASKMANGISSRAMARSSRQVSRSSTRRSNSFIASHRNKMSMELTTQAESKFFALVDLMASASREASSLKEFWGRIVAERESFNQEREELLEQVTEVTQELEQRDTEQRQQGTASIERKKHVEKLLLELSIAIQNVATEKKRYAERDHELGRTREELHKLKETYSRTHTDHEKFRKELQTLQLLLKTVEEDRDGARNEADRHYKDLLRITRERTEINSKLTDLTTKHEQARKDVLVLSDRIKVFDLEREERHREVDRLREESRKAKVRVEDLTKELVDVTEKLERVDREYHKVKEVVRIVEVERDDYFRTIDHLRRDLKVITTARDHAEEMCSNVNIKHDHVKRELATFKERFHVIETERTELVENLEKTRDQHRLLVIERDELRDETDAANKKADDQHRRLLAVVETLQKTESALSEVRTDCVTLTERVKTLDRELDHSRHQAGGRHAEITLLKEKIAVFQAEIHAMTEVRDRLRDELEKSRADFEEVTEEITTYGAGNKELEFEIESLRTLLREAREQKERAITARNSADQERDIYIAKYEEKCRELERFEESAASRYHAYVRSGEGNTTTSRVFSHRSNATTLNHNSHR